jgi:hypothetical protein
MTPQKWFDMAGTGYSPDFAAFNTGYSFANLAARNCLAIPPQPPAS